MNLGGCDSAPSSHCLRVQELLPQQRVRRPRAPGTAAQGPCLTWGADSGLLAVLRSVPGSPRLTQANRVLKLAPGGRGGRFRVGWSAVRQVGDTCGRKRPAPPAGGTPPPCARDANRSRVSRKPGPCATSLHQVADPCQAEAPAPGGQAAAVRGQVSRERGAGQQPAAGGRARGRRPWREEGRQRPGSPRGPCAGVAPRSRPLRTARFDEHLVKEGGETFTVPAFLGSILDIQRSPFPRSRDSVPQWAEPVTYGGTVDGDRCRTEEGLKPHFSFLEVEALNISEPVGMF